MKMEQGKYYLITYDDDKWLLHFDRIEGNYYIWASSIRIYDDATGSVYQLEEWGALEDTIVHRELNQEERLWFDQCMDTRRVEDVPVFDLKNNEFYQIF